MGMCDNAESSWVEVCLLEFCDSRENKSQISSVNNIVRRCLSNLYMECVNGYKVLLMIFILLLYVCTLPANSESTLTCTAISPQ